MPHVDMLVVVFTGLLDTADSELPKITIASPSNEKTLYLYEVCPSKEKS